jgi:hypothetical protein
MGVFIWLNILLAFFRIIFLNVIWATEFCLNIKHYTLEASDATDNCCFYVDV